MESLPCSKEYMLLPSCAAEAESKAGKVHRDQMHREDRDALWGAEGGPGFLQQPRGRRCEETSSPASVPWPAWTSSFTCTVKVEAEEKGVYGSAAFPPFLKKMVAVQGGDRPQGKTRPLTESSLLHALLKPLLPMSRGSNVGCSHTVALLAQLRGCLPVLPLVPPDWPLDLPTGCPRKGLRWGCWVAMTAGEWTSASRSPWPSAHGAAGSQSHPVDLLCPAGSRGGRRPLGYTTTEITV
ncbi:uncharacterized protein LOC113480018 [Athene cunicularia]|uniref:uncharacterized protein LOC113480018 n=1 Tax=Athene cunicularia TaxID=194338 RepID=UPI000EF663EB|nr:uncharacterized protein LOC113480018 [Athene cunicularia]